MANVKYFFYISDYWTPQGKGAHEKLFGKQNMYNINKGSNPAYPKQINFPGNKT